MTDQHLPSGREPGAQTRTAKVRWRGAKLFGYPLVVVLIGGGVVLLGLGVRTAVGDESYAALKVVLVAACAVLCLSLALLILDRLVKRRLTGVDVDVEPVEAQRGRSLRARVAVTSQRRPPRLLVGLVGSEHWEDDRGEAPVTRKSVEWEQWFEVDLHRGVDQVDFSIPIDGPFSYEGTLISLSWAVAAVTPRMLFESRKEVPVWVSP
jgi:hypothetical protein